MEIIFYILLGITSIVGVAFIIERGWALQWNKVIPPRVEEAVQKYLSPDDLPRLREVCHSTPSPVSRLLLVAMDHLEWTRTENVEVVQTRARHEMNGLERGLVVLEIIIGIAPLLGLVGTIFGLIALFGSMGTQGGTTEDQANFSRGISVALQATLMGLLTAIPALIAWSYYSKKVENLGVGMEIVCDEFLRRNYHSSPSEESARLARLEVSATTATPSVPPLPVVEKTPVSAKGPAPKGVS